MGAWARCEELCSEGDADTETTGNPTVSLGGCDTVEVVAAAACGILGGLADVFLVGAPGGKASLETWADEQVDGCVKKFARMTGWNPRGANPKVANAIQHLEKAYKVNYDQHHTTAVNGHVKVGPTTHHIMSLAHAPDPIGLFFSILNQFTSTSTFVDGGALITERTDPFDPAGNDVGKAMPELFGKTPVAKLFCGFVNWLGHVISDIAGSHGTRSETAVSNGSGVAAPFYELLQFCNFGSFDLGGGKQGDLAELAVRVFQEGYDARFALSLGVPVLMTELAIRLIYAVEQRFRYERPLSECLATKTNDGLRTMLLVGMGILCSIDGADAAAKSGGGSNAVAFATRLNYLAWLRLTMLVIRELGIRLSLERDVEAMRKLNQAYESYLEELKELDIEAFEREEAAYGKFAKRLHQAKTEVEVNQLLESTYDVCDIERPWRGDFDAHMADRNATLRFA